MWRGSVKHKSCPRLKRFLQGIILASAPVIAGGAWAEQVTLKSSDGTVNLIGDLISFADDNYIIRTDIGDLRIAANRVRCEGEGCPQIAAMTGDVVIAGSDTIGEGLMPLMMDGFSTFLNAEVKKENASVEGEFVASFVAEQGFGDAIGSYLVSATTSADAFAKLMEGSAQIGMSSRRITPDEARALKNAGAGNMIDPTQEHIIAVDSLVVIVNPENSVSELSIADLKKIYTGEITNWAEVGGPDLAISLVTRTEDVGTFGVFSAGVLGENTKVATTAFVAADNNTAAAFVNDNPGGIAFVGYAFQRGQKPLTLISECGLGTTPDAFSVKTEEYALFRRLYLYNRGDLDSALARQFLDFASSSTADAVIQQAGFINLGVELQVNDMTNPRAVSLKASDANSLEKKVIAEMLAELEVSDRLSSTFRFRTGSSELDPRGQRDLALLTDYLAALPEGAKITFVGFSDNFGEFEPNRSLSKGRAAEVEKAIKALAGNRLANVTFNAIGFGEIAPAACNNSDLGRSINRRVETWISKG